MVQIEISRNNNNIRHASPTAKSVHSPFSILHSAFSILLHSSFSNSLSHSLHSSLFTLHLHSPAKSPHKTTRAPSKTLPRQSNAASSSVVRPLLFPSPQNDVIVSPKKKKNKKEESPLWRQREACR